MAKTSTADSILKRLDSIAEEAAEAIDALLEDRKQVDEDVKAKLKDLATEANAKKKSIDEKIRPLNEAYERAKGKFYTVLGDGEKKSGGGGGGGRRQRRAKEDLEAIAQKIYDFIAGHKNGVTGPEIRAKVGLEAADNISVLLATYAPDKKIKTEGARKSLKYLAA
jgi:hypothetical protein